MTQKTLNGPNGLRIVLDSSEIFPDDPGNGTPAMVHKGQFSATYWCAADTGELNEPHDYELSAREHAWLVSDAIETAVNEFIETHDPA